MCPPGLGPVAEIDLRKISQYFSINLHYELREFCGWMTRGSACLNSLHNVKLGVGGKYPGFQTSNKIISLIKPVLY